MDTQNTLSPAGAGSVLTKEMVMERLNQVMDPELGISIVKLGLIYDVTVKEVEGQNKVHLVMTLTTPGCPLAAVFDGMIKDALFGLPNFSADHDLSFDLTFDPPWVPDMMDEEAKAELGF
jgi:metal-sulfur cluster biosynthetic enzyme